MCGLKCTMLDLIWETAHFRSESQGREGPYTYSKGDEVKGWTQVSATPGRVFVCVKLERMPNRRQRIDAFPAQ